MTMPLPGCRWILWLLAVGSALASEPAVLPGTQGATAIPVTMPCDGKATLALYTPQGQLVRILAQAIPLKQGTYTARWDGMDLWGNLLPAGTPLQARLVYGPGVRAFYEFAAGLGDADPKDTPWLTRPTGEGLAMRTGGWLGDHTGPGTVAAMGDRVFIGSALVEYGHPLIACDLDGHKLWGGRLAGWDGPTQLIPFGTTLVARVKNAVFAIDPVTYETTRLFDTATNGIRTLAAGNGQFVLLLDNPQSRETPFRYAVRHDNIRFNMATPSANGDSAPEFQLGPAKRFSTVFGSDGGHFQTGITPEWKDGAWHVVVPFKQPVPVGTLVLESIEGVAAVEAYVLAPGREYDPAADGVRAGPSLAGHWDLLGQTGLTQRVVLLTARAKAPLTGALYLRLLPPRGTAPATPPTLAMCRVLDKRVEAAGSPARITVPEGAAVKSTPAGGWDFRTPVPVSAENPATLIADFGRPLACDGVLFLNNTSTRTAIERLAGDGQPSAEAQSWEPLAEYRVTPRSKEGHASASKLHHNAFVAFPTTVTARALRLRVTDAYGAGKVALARPPDDPMRVDCDFMLPVRLLDERPTVAPHLYQVRKADGQVIASEPGDYGDIRLLAMADDGTLYSVCGSNTLARTAWVQGALRHTVLNTNDTTRPVSLAVVRNELVVGDDHRVVFLDRTGKRLRQIGTEGYTRGPWDRNRIGYASGVTVDRNGKTWIAEAAYSPKRVSRFSTDGRCEKEFFGPPQYGGGGWLDPNLKSFYYRGLEFELDWEHGTSRLKNCNDRVYSEESPALDGSSFGYTQVGRPIELNGRRYIVGDPGMQFSPGVVICLLDGPVWKPCAVMGTAKDSPFLVKKAVWKAHWLAQDLTDRFFIWVDRNGDGQYQIDEVDVFAKTAVPGNPFDGGYWGAMIGPDLTVWGHAGRLAPSSFTAQGVPLYERKNIQRFKYADLAPFYSKAQSYGSRAAAEPGRSTIVCADGSLSICGQPYRVLPDLTIAGGPVTATPSDFVPPVNGRLISQSLHFAGSAVTTSAVGEVTMHVGDNGIWSISSAKDCVMLDQIFTGADGNWGSDLPPQRGIEVTGRRHDQETFFGHFIKAHNGRYYTVSGKGFHAISRVEGLDDFRVSTAPVTVSAADGAANQALRARIVAREKARAEAGKRAGSNRTLKAPALSTLKGKPAVDGWVDEWTTWESMDWKDDPNAPAAPVFFAVAHDDRGLTLAYRGATRTGNRNDDPAYLFKDGFALDLRYRIDSDKKTGDVIQGDRRVVFGRNKARWIAVLYDYVNPETPSGKAMDFTSPILSTHVADVSILPAADVPMAFRADAIPAGNQWAFEVFLPWTTLGFERRPSKSIRFDVGAMLPDSGGITVERRLSWSDPGPLPVSDVGYEAEITPGMWGTLELK